MAKRIEGPEELRKAQIKGEIATLPESMAAEEEKPEEKKAAVIDDPHSFQAAIAEAQMEGGDHVIVSEKLFQFLLKKAKGNRYLTYGNPGIKVYCEGTKEACDVEDEMSAESYHNYIMKKEAQKQ